MRIGWRLYWLSLLAMSVAWFTATSADGTAACREAAPPPPLDEFGPNGISLFPPGYECLYIRGDTVEPLDAAGWFEWGLTVGILVLVCCGAVGGLVWLVRLLGR